MYRTGAANKVCILSPFVVCSGNVNKQTRQTPHTGYIRCYDSPEETQNLMAHLSPHTQLPSWIIYSRHGCPFQFSWQCGPGRSASPTPRWPHSCHRSGHPQSLSPEPCVAANKTVYIPKVFKRARFLVAIYLVTWQVHGPEGHVPSKWIASIPKNKLQY